jgi:hypothetical protein
MAGKPQSRGHPEPVMMRAAGQDQRVGSRGSDDRGDDGGSDCILHASGVKRSRKYPKPAPAWLEAWPKGAKPVVELARRDQVWLSVTECIRRALVPSVGYNMSAFRTVAN